MSNDKKNIKKIPTSRVNINLPDDVILLYKNKANELGVPFSNLITIDVVNLSKEREEKERLSRNSQYSNFNKRK